MRGNATESQRVNIPAAPRCAEKCRSSLRVHLGPPRSRRRSGGCASRGPQVLPLLSSLTLSPKHSSHQQG